MRKVYELIEWTDFWDELNDILVGVKLRAFATQRLAQKQWSETLQQLFIPPEQNVVKFNICTCACDRSHKIDLAIYQTSSPIQQLILQKSTVEGMSSHLA